MKDLNIQLFIIEELSFIFLSSFRKEKKEYLRAFIFISSSSFAKKKSTSFLLRRN